MLMLVMSVTLNTISPILPAISARSIVRSMMQPSPRITGPAEFRSWLRKWRRACVYIVRFISLLRDSSAALTDLLFEEVVANLVSDIAFLVNAHFIDQAAWIDQCVDF